MKTSFKIRAVLAAVFATLASAGLLAHVVHSGYLFWVSWLLIVSCAELNEPMPRKDYLPTFGGLGTLIALLILSVFHPLGLVVKEIDNPVPVTGLWFLWMWVIYRWYRTERNGPSTESSQGTQTCNGN